MSEANQPPAPPGMSRPEADLSDEEKDQYAGLDPAEDGGSPEPGAKPEEPLPVQQQELPPGQSQMGDGARLDPRGDAEQPVTRMVVQRPTTGNPYRNLPEMKAGFYRKTTPGRIRNPVSGTVYTHTTASQVIEPDSWDRSQLAAKIIAPAPGGQKRSV